MYFLPITFLAAAEPRLDAAWSMAAQGLIFLVYQLFAAATGFCLGVVVGGPVLKVLVSGSLRGRREETARSRLAGKAGGYVLTLVVVTALFWLIFRLLAIGYALGLLWGMYRTFGHLKQTGEYPPVFARAGKAYGVWSRRVTGRKRERPSAAQNGRAPIGRYGARQLSREDRQQIDELLRKWQRQVDRLHALADAADDDEQAEKLRAKAARIEGMMQEL